MSSDVWKKWEGQVVDHKYQLLRYLGTTDHSLVFLAEFHDPEPRQAAVKFISAEFGNKDEQIAAWKETSNLSHPSLIQIYGAGLCQIEEMSLLYVAMEYAEENLAQVLPQRALMAEETSQVLNSLVDVLVYLHGMNLVHGHIKPSNILAKGEVLKLSSDTIFPGGAVREMRRERSAYDAPELPASASTQAADIWSLGVTLVEALSQQHAVLPFNEQADPIIPAAVREPYLEISRHALKREPRLRWTSARIAERLNPTATAARSVAAGAGASARTAAVSASASASASAAGTTMAAVIAAAAPPVMPPTQVPLSSERAIPLAEQPPITTVRPRVPSGLARDRVAPPRETLVLPNYVIPLFAGALVVIALILIPFVLRHRVASPTAPVGASTSSNAARPASLPDAKTSASNAEPTVSASAPPARTVADTAPAVTPAPTAVSSKDSAHTASKAPSVPAGKGEVLDQATPEASAKALSTIHGTVRVGVAVHVDAAGNVSTAELDSPGPSHYFADLSLKAARQWVFTPPEADGKSVPSDWKIQFHYTHSGVQMSSEEVAP